MSLEQLTPPPEDPEPLPSSPWHEQLQEYKALQATTAAVVEKVSALVADESNQPFLYGHRREVVNKDGAQVRILKRGFYGVAGTPAHDLYQKEMQSEVARIEFLPIADDASPEWYTINRDDDNNFALQRHFLVASDTHDGQWLEWSTSVSAADAATLLASLELP